MKNRIFLLYSFFLFIFVIVGSDKEKGIAPKKVSVFNIDTFEQNIINGFNAGGNHYFCIGSLVPVIHEKKCPFYNAPGIQRVPVDYALLFAFQA